MHGLLLLLIAWFAPTPPEIAISIVSVGGQPVAAFATDVASTLTVPVSPLLAALALETTTSSKSSTLHAQVYDAMLDGYIDVTSTQGDTETVGAFTKRFRDLAGKLLLDCKAWAEEHGIDWLAAKKLYDSTH